MSNSRREKLLRKIHGDDWKNPPNSVVGSDRSANLKPDPGAPSSKHGGANRAWPKPPTKLVAHTGKIDSKTPLPVRATAALGSVDIEQPSAKARSAVAGAAAASVPTEYDEVSFDLVRAPRTEITVQNLLRLREGSEVPLNTLKKPVVLKKIEDEVDEQLETSFPTSGEGAEYGRAAKEALRRRKYARKKDREIAMRYHLEDAGGCHLLGEVQHDLRGKLFLIRRRGTQFIVVPVKDAVEFRRFRENRGGAVDGEAADKNLKQYRPSGVSRLLKKSLTQKSERQRYLEDATEHLDPKEISMEDERPTKKTVAKTRALPTLRSVNLFTNDLDDEDFDEEINFAPDDDAKLGGLGARTAVNDSTGVSFALESSSEESSEDEVDIRGDVVIRRQRLDEDAEEEEAYLENVGEQDDAEDDLTNEEQVANANRASAKPPDSSPAGSATSAAQSKAPRAREASDPEGEAPAKRRKIVATVGRKLHGLEPAMRKEIRSDLEKYLRRASVKGITIPALLKKLRKKAYFKTHTDKVRDYLLKVLPEMTFQKKIEGEDRYVFKE